MDMFSSGAVTASFHTCGEPLAYQAAYCTHCSLDLRHTVTAVHHTSGVDLPRHTAPAAYHICGTPYRKRTLPVAYRTHYIRYPLHTTYSIPYPLHTIPTAYRACAYRTTTAHHARCIPYPLPSHTHCTPHPLRTVPAAYCLLRSCCISGSQLMGMMEVSLTLGWHSASMTAASSRLHPSTSV